MIRTLLVSALLFSAPSALIAAPQAETHEIVRQPAGKTVMAFREINRQQNASIKCHPDPTKAFLCHGRTNTQSELASARRAERLSER